MWLDRSYRLINRSNELFSAGYTILRLLAQIVKHRLFHVEHRLVTSAWLTRSPRGRSEGQPRIGVVPGPVEPERSKSYRFTRADRRVPKHEGEHDERAARHQIPRAVRFDWSGTRTSTRTMACIRKQATRGQPPGEICLTGEPSLRQDGEDSSTLSHCLGSFSCW
jgi:hypothetical protein